MNINKCIIRSYFEIVRKGIENEITVNDIANFLNSLSISMLEEAEDCLKVIDDIGFQKTLSIDIISLLIKNNFLYTPLIYCAENNMLQLIDFSENYKEKIIQELDYIIKNNIDIFHIVRKYIIQNNLSSEYKKLFSMCFIIREEYILIKDAKLAILLLNTDYIQDDTIDLAVEIISSRNYTSEETLFLFKHLFDKNENENCVTDNEIIHKLVDEINFDTINIESLNDKEKEIIVDLIRVPCELEDAENALNFMNRAKCLVPSLEKTVQNNELIWQDYVTFLNSLNNCSETTVKWIKEKVVEYGLSPMICEKLKQYEYYVEFIPAVSLRENHLFIDNNIPFGNYVTVFSVYDLMFDIMKDNIWFLEHLRDSELYDELNWDKFKEVIKVEQTAKCFKYIFTKYDDEQKMYYLNHYHKFKTEEDSKEFQLMICKSTNMELLGSKELRDKIRESIWESNPYHKGQFTKCWNARWKKKI